MDGAWPRLGHDTRTSAVIFFSQLSPFHIRAEHLAWGILGQTLLDMTPLWLACLSSLSPVLGTLEADSKQDQCRHSRRLSQRATRAGCVPWVQQGRKPSFNQRQLGSAGGDWCSG